MIEINTKGLEFVLTALFIVILINQWKATKIISCHDRYYKCHHLQDLLWFFQLFNTIHVINTDSGYHIKRRHGKEQACMNYTTIELILFLL